MNANKFINLENMQNVPNLAKAVVAVMKRVKGIDKGMTIGSGTNSYKGVADVDVKEAIGEAMQEEGLCILPIGVESKIQIDRWEEEDGFSRADKKPIKTKQSVFTEVTTRYLLIHSSGESIELAGYGHGIDSQDKGAGKATTYALKNTLLYSFLVPTKKIDDTDNTHSENMNTPPNPILPDLLPNTPQWKNAVKHLLNGVTMAQIKASANLTPKNEELLKQAVLS